MKVTIVDTYDFDEYRDGNGLGERLNNWGYDMQNNEVIHPYSWDATYVIYTKWE